MKEAKLLASQSGLFGIEVSMDGDRILGGARAAYIENTVSGAAYVFRREGTTWIEEAQLLSANAQYAGLFGDGVVIRGDRVVVGAPGEEDDRGNAYVFERQGSTWTNTATLSDSDPLPGSSFGWERSVGISGDTAIVGANRRSDPPLVRSGAAYIFDESSGVWTESFKLNASDAATGDEFARVSLEDDRLLVGAMGDATDTGAAYVFERHGVFPPHWDEDSKLTATGGDTGEEFGKATALNGDRLLVGATYADVGSTNTAGAAYVYELPDVNANLVQDACEQNFAFDADGNLLDDENMVYTWDGENRLVKAVPKIVADGSLQVTNTYDYLGRRVRRLREFYKESSGTWTADSSPAIEMP